MSAPLVPHNPGRLESTKETGGGHVAAPPAKIRFRIERLTFEGFSTAEQERFARAFAGRITELAECYRDLDWQQAGAEEIRSLQLGELSPGASPEAAAASVAMELFRRLRRGTGRDAHEL